jgi:transposase InsO family protein
VGRSKTTREHQGTNNSEVLLAKHNLQIFGVPRELTVDNGKQFDCNTFKEYCKSLGTHAKFLSVYHPQSNGVVERANGLIFSGIKKCLFDQKKGKWVDELLKVIWSHNTTVSRAAGFTPFRLLFGTKAMTPEETRSC